jgi:hypothetical protein
MSSFEQPGFTFSVPFYDYALAFQAKQNSPSVYPNGTIIRFECGNDPRLQGQAGSIKCLNGEWHSQLLPCGSFICKKY